MPSFSVKVDPNTWVLQFPTAANFATSNGIATLTGTQTLTNKTLTAPRFANNGFIADANGNEVLQFVTSASAVNHVRISNVATTGGPIIEAQGDDSNIPLIINAKGLGVVQINDSNLTISTTSATFAVNLELADGVIVSGGNIQLDTNVGITDVNGNELLKFTAAGAAVNEITIGNASTGTGPAIEATGGDTDINLTIAPKGTGFVSLVSGSVFKVSATQIDAGVAVVMQSGLNVQSGTLIFGAVGAMADTPVADGTYTVGIGGTQNGTITTANGVIIAVQEAIA